MTVITTLITVRPDGSISSTAPLPEGEYAARMEVLAPDRAAVLPLADLSDMPVFDVGGWPEGTTFGRDEIYGDDGR